MTADQLGIWVRITLQGGTDVSGFVERAESPNDFWVLFKTHFVRVENAVEQRPTGERISHAPDPLYVNRDLIIVVKMLPSQP